MAFGLGVIFVGVAWSVAILLPLQGDSMLWRLKPRALPWAGEEVGLSARSCSLHGRFCGSSGKDIGLSSRFGYSYGKFRVCDERRNWVSDMVMLFLGGILWWRMFALWCCGVSNVAFVSCGIHIDAFCVVSAKALRGAG